MIESLIAVIIFSLTLWFVGSPLFKKEEETLISSVNDNLRLKKETVLSTIRDLELDFALKKISDDQYQELKNQAYQEGAEILKKIDKDQENKDWKERIEKDLERMKHEI